MHSLAKSCVRFTNLPEIYIEDKVFFNENLISCTIPCLRGSIGVDFKSVNIFVIFEKPKFDNTNRMVGVFYF